MVSIIKYKTNDGIPTLKTSELFDLYEKIEKADLFKVVLPEVTYVDPHLFINLIFSGQIELYVIYDNKVPAAVFWCSDKSTNTVISAHGLVFEEFREKSKDYFLLGVEELFKEQTTIVFQVPKRNVIAQKFLEKVGVEKGCVIPQATYHSSDDFIDDVVLFYINRERNKLKE